MRPAAEELLSGARARRGELVDLLLSLASIDAPSGGGPAALGPAADEVARVLETLGGRLTRTPGPQGELLELELGPEDGRPVVVLGHYDTVWPEGTVARRPPRLHGDTVRGPGVFDMRSGITAAIVALRLLGSSRLPLPTILLLTPDEETGSATSQRRIVELALAANWVLVLEPPLPGGSLKTARSGWAVYRLEALGRPAHAGLEPEKGVSAIEELCDALLSIRNLPDAARGTSLNVGMIAGGTGANTVAGQAHALIDLRASSTAEQKRVDRELHALRPVRTGASLQLRGLHTRPVMERTPAIVEAFEHARAAAAMLGIELREGPARGTSDANLFAHRGVRVLDGLGPDGGGAHSEDEHVLVDSLVERAALIGSLLAQPPVAPAPGLSASSPNVDRPRA